VDKFKQVGPPRPGSRPGWRTSAQADAQAQVEDTLNNSNDLFMTFRKEMEDMSKKTKRLERENENLKRKHDQVNGNILKMAEDRGSSTQAAPLPMSMANPTMASATVLPRPATPVANGAPNQSTTDPAHAGHPVAGHDNRQAPAPPAAVPGKKGKQKKTPEPTEASKLIAQRISQLELDAAGEKDQEAEIGGCTSP